MLFAARLRSIKLRRMWCSCLYPVEMHLGTIVIFPHGPVLAYIVAITRRWEKERQNSIADSIEIMDPTVAYATIQNEQTKRFRSFFFIVGGSALSFVSCTSFRVQSLFAFNTGLLWKTWWNEMHFFAALATLPTVSDTLVPHWDCAFMHSTEQVNGVSRRNWCSPSRDVFWCCTKSTSHRVCDLEYFSVVWNSLCLFIVIVEWVNVWAILNPKFRGKKYKTVIGN